MDDNYAPKSAFLLNLAHGDIPLSGSQFAEQNVKLLISFMRDSDLSNRDWATMLLSTTEIDTPRVRAALISATQDEDAEVRAEALEGLAIRNELSVLPMLKKELLGDTCAYGTFIAARLAAHPSLLPSLRKWASQPNLGSHVRSAINDAILACNASVGNPRDWTVQGGC